MNELKQKINDHVNILRSLGVTGKLYIAPVCNIRCFAPCGAGLCICDRSLSNEYCIVSEDGKKRAMEHKSIEIEFLQKYVDQS